MGGGGVISSMPLFSASSVVRSTRFLFEFVFLIFFVRVIFFGEATDSEGWLPWKFFCGFFDLIWLMIVFDFCSCFCTNFSRFEIRRLALALSVWLWSIVSVALAIAKAVAVVAFITSNDFIFVFNFIAAVAFLVISLCLYHTFIVVSLMI